MTGIAVLVPTRRDNEEDVHLDHVLQSLLAQRRLPSRVLIRDEGSAGAFAKRTVRQFADLLSAQGIDVGYRRVLRPTGVASARRDLVTWASDADLLCFVDDDLCLHPDALARLYEAMEEHADAGFAQGQKVETDPRRTYWNDINRLNGGQASSTSPFRIWFGDAALLMLRPQALEAVDWDVVTRYAVDGLGGEDVAITLMIADRHPGFAVPAAVGWHLSPRQERWRWEAASDALQVELLRPHVSADTLRRALPHLAEHIR